MTVVSGVTDGVIGVVGVIEGVIVVVGVIEGVILGVGVKVGVILGVGVLVGVIVGVGVGEARINLSKGKIKIQFKEKSELRTENCFFAEYELELVSGPDIFLNDPIFKECYGLLKMSIFRCFLN